MKLKNIKLENIRSYTNGNFDFSDGTILLSGDIGSGKSTILLSLEFVLFGLAKGSLTGSALLRNGEKKGSVELTFEIDGKPVTIKRVLKRGTSVTQDAGFYVIDGVKTDASPVEIKQFVISLLNYPQELLTKSKCPVYRYTVYTPQEEMKQILLGEKDVRLDTLRRVFGIDKYKRMKQNAELFMSNIKAKKKEFAAFIIDLDEKKQAKELQVQEREVLQEKIVLLKPKLDALAAQIKLKKEALQKFEQQIEELNNLKKDLEVNQTTLKHKIVAKKQNDERIGVLTQEITALEKELVAKPSGEVKQEDVTFKETNIKEKEQLLLKVRNKMQEIKVKKAACDELITSIASLDICPICKQKVSETHIHGIHKTEQGKVKAFEQELEGHIRKEQEHVTQVENLKKELDALKAAQHASGLIQFKVSAVEDKKKERASLDQELVATKESIGKLNTVIASLQAKVEQKKDVNALYQSEREDLEKSQSEQHQWEFEKLSLTKEVEKKDEMVKTLELEIVKKEKKKANLDYLDQLQHWLSTYFVNLMQTMEKKIMLRVHHDFNSLFQKWFDMLVNNEDMKVSLDEEFSPLINQAGHEIDYNYLSGGEKTAAALSYRLALNQVINSLLSTIKTKDLIILDEPTDGFSSEQLDHMRAVLDELNVAQVLLVSHESKIESFVQNVIRLEKQEHQSRKL